MLLVSSSRVEIEGGDSHKALETENFVEGGKALKELLLPHPPPHYFKGHWGMHLLKWLSHYLCARHPKL